MRPKKYPREPLARLRAKEVDDAAHGLAKAVRAREEAERVARSIAKTRDSAEAAARATRETERAALERGELRAGDLMQASGWTARVVVEREEMQRRAASSAERARAAQAVEEGARATVASTHAKAEVVRRDSASWHQEERARANARDEEEASEAWRKR